MGLLKYLLKFIFPFLRSGVEAKPALSSATQHAMPPESGKKWGTECLNIRFPLPTLLCEGYSVKLKKKYLSHASVVGLDGSIWM